MAKKWAKFPHGNAYMFDVAGLKKSWARLHRGDNEPLPKDAPALEAWRHFHAGDFSRAVETGLAAGGAGINAAIKAQAIHANYLEKAAKTSSRCSRRQRISPMSGGGRRRQTLTRITSMRMRWVATAREFR